MDYKKDQACTSWWRLQAALLSSVNPPVAHTQMSQSHGTDRLLWRTKGRVRMSTANQMLYWWRTWRQTELAVPWDMCQMTRRYSVRNQTTYTCYGLIHLHDKNNNRPTNILLCSMQHSILLHLYKVAQPHILWTVKMCSNPPMILPCILNAFIIYLHQPQMPFGRKLHTHLTEAFIQCS